jgi:hypothetical protein
VKKGTSLLERLSVCFLPLPLLLTPAYSSEIESTLKANESRHRASAVACDFSLRRGWPGGAVFFIRAAIHHDRRDFRIRCAAAGPKPGEELPPEFLGWIFAIVGLLLSLLGIAMAICILLAGRCLSRNKHYTFALVMACIECLFIPFGTILGVFTIIALSRESVRTLFSTGTAQAPCRNYASDFES